MIAFIFAILGMAIVMVAWGMIRTIAPKKIAPPLRYQLPTPVVESRYTSIKDILDNCLPATPVACMWKVEKIKRQFYLVVRFERDNKVTDSVVMNRYSEIIWDDHPQFEELRPQAYGAVQAKYLAKITLMGPDGEFGSTEIRLDGEDADFLNAFAKTLKIKTQAILADYSKDESDWDGIYIKS